MATINQPINTASSLTWGDLYGKTGLAKGPVGETTEAASSGTAGEGSNAPAFTWLGFVLALILLRIAWHYS